MNLSIPWQLPSDGGILHTLDAHTAGEPLRILIGGVPQIPGDTILAKRRYFREHLDGIRTGLMWEPRGHADMYGAVLCEANSPEADFGVFFIHNEGYSTMCGHAVIALATALLEVGLLKKEGDSPQILMDTPAGRVLATAHWEKGKVKQVSFQNVPSFVYALDQQIQVEGIGEVSYDIAFGGAFYVYCDADTLGIGLQEENFLQLIDWGRRIKQAVMAKEEIIHPFEEDLGFLYGTIFIGKAQNPAHHSRNVCVFADGEVDRSPTGTGVSGRAALHLAKGELALNQAIRIESILGTTMEVRALSKTEFGGYAAIVPEVTGSAHVTGRHSFYFDPQDSLRNGFIFR